MKDDRHFSSRAVENAMRTKDVIDRARAATPVNAGQDVLRRPVDGMDERFGLSADYYRKD